MKKLLFFLLSLIIQAHCHKAYASQASSPLDDLNKKETALIQAIQRIDEEYGEGAQKATIKSTKIEQRIVQAHITLSQNPQDKNALEELHDDQKTHRILLAETEMNSPMSSNFRGYHLEKILLQHALLEVKYDALVLESQLGQDAKK